MLGLGRRLGGGSGVSESIIPVAAYSVRLLDNNVGISYSGPAMRIRRDNDDEEIDVGYDLNGDLNTAAIAAHCTTNNGYVSKWYSQTGQYDAVQESFANQALIYSGSAQAVRTQDGKPCIEGGKNYKTQIPDTDADTKASYSVVARNTNIYASFFTAIDSPNYWNHQGSQFSGQMRFVQTNSIGTFNQNIYTDTAGTNGAQAHYLATNGVRGRYANSTAQFSKELTLSTWSANNYSKTISSDFYNFHEGRWKTQEVILWLDDCSSMNEDIEEYVNDYFQIY